MTAIDGAMGRHPAGRARIERLVADAQDQQAIDLANRELVDLEAWGMSPMRRIDEWHHELSTGPRRAWVNVVAPFMIGLALFLVIFGAGILGELYGGWPA